MSNKQYISRIQNKHDIEANWIKAVNFIPLKGEIIIYDVDENHSYPRVKIGDEVNTITNLPFLSNEEKINELIIKHIQDIDVSGLDLDPDETINIIKQKDGAISVTKQAIKIAASQVADFDAAVGELIPDKSGISASATDDDVVILTLNASYDASTDKYLITADGKHLEAFGSTYNSANTTTSIKAGESKTIKIPQLSVDKYGHTVAAADESVTITIPSIPSSVSSAVQSVSASGDGVITLNAEKTGTSVTITGAHSKEGVAYTDNNTATSISGYGATATIKIPQIQSDAYGHVVSHSEDEVTITMPPAQTIPDLVDGGVSPTGNTISLSHEDSFTVLTDVDINGHTVTPRSTIYTLPKVEVTNGTASNASGTSFTYTESVQEKNGDISTTRKKLTTKTAYSTTNPLATIQDIVDKFSTIDGAMEFKGVQSEIPTDNSSFNKGDVIIVGKIEYVYDGTNWVAIGNEDIDTEYIQELINKGLLTLNSTDSSQDGYYVSGVSLVNGGIQVNETALPNHFSTIRVGDKTLSPDSLSDVLTLAQGNNITLVGDEADDKITISAKDTTYTAGSGLKLTGTEFNHDNTVAAKTSYPNTSTSLKPSHGGTFKVRDVKYDTEGHITSSQDVTVTLPSETTLTDGGLSPTGNTVNLDYGDSITVVTDVDVSGHTVTPKTTVYTIPSSDNVNTAHTHSGGVGLVRNGNGGISGDVSYKVALKSETKNSSAAGNGKLYPVELDSNGVLAVNVPWTNNNTTYTAGSGLDLNGTEFNHSNTVSAKSNYDGASSNTSLSHGGTFIVDQVQYDTEGHITGSQTKTYKLPSENYAFKTISAKNSSGTATGNVVADSVTDTLTLKEGSNITLSADADTDTITISAADTKYTAGSGLKLTGTEFNHNNSITARSSYSNTSGDKSPGYGGSFYVADFKYDTEGHVTGVQTNKITMPAAQTIPTLADGGVSATGTKTNLSHQDTITVLTDVDVSGHTVTPRSTQFVLPSETSLTKGTDKPGTATTLTHGGTFSAVTDTTVNGHTIYDTVTTFTLPSETSLVDGGVSATGTTTNLEHEDTFTVLTDVDVNGHTVTPRSTKFKLPKPTMDIYYIEGSGSSTGAWKGSHERITQYTPGLTIAYKLDAAGSSSGVTLDINGLGAKTVYRNASTNVSTAYPIGAVALFIYTEDDGVGTWKAADYDTNTTYTNVKLGHGYTTSSTAASTTAKTASLSSYTLTTGGIVAVKFTEGNTATSMTLNVNSKGAKTVYLNGSSTIPNNIIAAGDIVTFIYSSQYHIISIQKDSQTIGLAGAVTGEYVGSLDANTISITTSIANGTPTIDNDKNLTYVESIDSTGAIRKYVPTKSAVTDTNPLMTQTDVTSVVNTGISNLATIMRFRGIVTDDPETDTDKVLTLKAGGTLTPETGDVVIYETNKNEWIYDGSKWVELGDERIDEDKIESIINDVIDDLSKPDTAVANQYVSEVDQSNGVISVSRTSLPFEFGKVNIVNGSTTTTLDSDAVRDTLTIAAGTNITLTPDAANDKVTISSSYVDTTYTAGSGLKLTGTEFNHKNTVGAKSNYNGASSNTSISHGGTFIVDQVQYDTEGHITGSQTKTYKLPSESEAFKTVAIANSAGTSKGSVVADSATDTLNFKEGSNVTLTADANTDTITIAAKDTTYTAGSGLKLTGTEFNHNNSITARSSYSNTSGDKSPGYGGSFYVADVKYDTEGHITGIQTNKITMPAAQTIPTLTDGGVSPTGTKTNLSHGDTFTVLTDVDVSGHTVTPRSTQFVLPTATAHSHSNGIGLIRTGNGGISGDVSYKVALKSETKNSSAASSSGKLYPVELDSNGVLAVNVPWTDHNDNTTYTAGSGLKLTNTEFNHKNTVSAKSNYNAVTATDLSHAGSFTVDQVQYDTEGHITGSQTKTYKLPSENYAFKTITATNSAGTSKGSVVADSVTDTLTIVEGSNITLTPDATNDKITIAATDTKYTAGSGLSLTGTEFNHSNSITAGSVQGSSGTIAHGGTVNIPKITYDTEGHITEATTTSITLPAAQTIPTLSGGSAASDDTKVVGGVTVSGHAVTVAKKEIKNGSGISVTGSTTAVEINHSNVVAAKTSYPNSSTSLKPAHGGTFKIRDVKYDTEGHITASQDVTVTLPSETTLTDGGVSSTGTVINLNHEDTLTVLTDIDVSGHTITPRSTNFKLPDPTFYYVEGSGSTNDSSTDTTSWIGTNSSIDSYYPGLVVAFKVDIAGDSTTTLNINNFGAVTVVKNNTTAVSTAYPVGSIPILVYTTDSDGTSYWKIAEQNSTYTNASLGQGKAGSCSTAAATKAKTASLSSYSLVTGGIVSVQFTNGNTSTSMTLNVNSKGAKNVYYHGSATIPTDLIGANDIVTFIYSSQYHIIGIKKKTQTIGLTGAVTGEWSGDPDSNIIRIPTLIGFDDDASTTTQNTKASMTYLAGIGATESGLYETKEFVVFTDAVSTANPLATKNYVTGQISNLANIMRFRGVVTSDPETDADKVLTLKAGGTLTPAVGDVVIYETNKNEWIYDGSKWVELGDERIDEDKIESVVNDAIDDLNYSDTAVAGKYVTEVDQTNGIISVSRDYFPTFHRTSGTATGTRTTTATNSPAINARTTDSGRYYGVESDKDGKMYVNVPWQTNTTYTAGSGLKLTNTEFNHSNSITAGTVQGSSGSASFGGTLSIPKITYDTEGHITGATTTSVTLPSDRLFVTLTPTGTQIDTVNTDLNTMPYLKVGRYFCSQNDTAKTLINCPTANAFMMEVSSPLSTTIDNESTKTWCYRLRKIIEYNTGIEFTQNCYSNGTAGNWIYGAWFQGPVSSVTINSDKTKVRSKGDANTPVYINSNGQITAGDVYAGGTALTVNGTSYSEDEVSIFAPLEKGSSGSVLVPGDPGPVWSSSPTLSSLKLSGSNGLSLDGGSATPANYPKITWGKKGDASPFIGYAADQNDGTFLLMSLAGGSSYANGLAIGGSSGNLLWKGKAVATQENATTIVNNAIQALDKDDTAVAGQYVSEVDQTNGIISVTRTNFPIAGANTTGVVKGFHRTSGTATGTKTTNATNAPAINARSTTSGKYYGVETDATGAMYVNVPWTDNNTDTKVKQSPSTTNGEFPILLRSTTAGTTETTTTASFKTTTTINPSTGRINIGTSESTIHGSYGAADVNLIEGDYDATYTSHGVLYASGSNGANMYYDSTEKCITFEFY